METVESCASVVERCRSKGSHRGIVASESDTVVVLENASVVGGVSILNWDVLKWRPTLGLHGQQ